MQFGNDTIHFKLKTSNPNRNPRLHEVNPFHSRPKKKLFNSGITTNQFGNPTPINLQHNHYSNRFANNQIKRSYEIVFRTSII
jgi:hypothetical protein